MGASMTDTVCRSRHGDSGFDDSSGLLQTEFDHEDNCDSDYESMCSCASSRLSPTSSIESSDSGVSEMDTDFVQPLCEERYILKHCEVTAVIPRCNKSQYSKDEFSLRIIHDASYVPPLNYRTFHATQIVSLEPHGTRFYKKRPALISLPLLLHVTETDDVVCLCSNTPEGVKPQWERLPSDRYVCYAEQVLIKASHFSLFTAVIARPLLDARQCITRTGGTLSVDGVPGIAVQFPAGALSDNVDAYVKVYFEDDICPPFVTDERHGILASPIIMVGPHGCHFNRENAEPVTVTLPVPSYHEVQQRFEQKVPLSVWQSSTTEEEPHVWERIHVELTIRETDADGVTVTFPVSHFSFFKVLWDVITASMYEARSTISYFYPYISFSMMCQAYMEENKDTLRFGLEVICFRSDKRLVESTNYRHRVGCSLRPKLVRTGRISIRLKSEMFEADVDAGEDKELVKEEQDFRGREFDKQFACRFKPNANVDRGTFGKVVVERVCTNGRNESLFEFNLNKTGCETEMKMETSDRWSVVAVKELAGTLHITDDDNWKKFARHIGFTKNEISSKLKYSDDPFLAMMNLYQVRGGTPEEFVQALYEVSRELQVAPTKESPGSASGSSWRRRFSFSGSGSPPGGGDRSPPMNQFRYRDDHSDTTGTPSSAASRKRSNPTPGNSSGSSKRRRRFSDVSETMSSSEGESGVQSEELKRDVRRLKDADLWDISAHMNIQSWRALGRRLGLQESSLLNIEHTHKASGFRECAYNMLLEWKGCKPKKCTVGNLYMALTKENMNSVARQMTIMNIGANDDRD